MSALPFEWAYPMEYAMWVLLPWVFLFAIPCINLSVRENRSGWRVVGDIAILFVPLWLLGVLYGHWSMTRWAP